MKVSRVFLALYACLAVGYAQLNVLTANYGNERTNANLQETQLTPASISADTFGKLGAFPVDGQVYGQPLFVSNLVLPGKGRKNVLFVGTMHNSVYAFDADAVTRTAPIWQVNLGEPVPSSYLQFGDVNPEVGILSTGAIDLERGVIYVVSDTFDRGSAVFRLHALSLLDGSEQLSGPVVVAGSVPGVGAGGRDNRVAFDANQQLQRPGLLISNGAVHVGFGSHSDQGFFHGWLFTYDASDLSRQIAIFMASPNGIGASIWQSGRGIAADSGGNIYAVTGNGDYDGTTNFSESIVKLSAGGLKLLDWFTPSDWEMLTDNDYDLSAGPAILPGTHNILAGNKFGNVYLVNGDALGHLNSDAATTSAKITAVDWGGVFNFAVWPRPDATFFYVHEQGWNLKRYRIVNGAFRTPADSIASVNADVPYVGLTISANGAQDGTGILWETTGNHVDPAVPGTLHAFDASDLTNELWNSDLNSDRDSLGAFAKFVSPTVANGRVYVPTFSNQVVIYGLLPSGGSGPSGPAISAVVNAASYSQDAISPGELVTLFGTNLGPSDSVGLRLDATGLVATELTGTSVLFDGIPAPMVAASSNQLSAVVPFGLATDTSQVQVEYDGQRSDPFAVQVAATCPSVFSLDATGKGQAAALNQDGSVNSNDNAASAGSIVILYATGGGVTSPQSNDGEITGSTLAIPVQPVLVQIGGHDADVLYAGAAPGMIAGVMQINVRVPGGAGPGPAVPVLLKIGDQSSQAGITIAVQ